MLSSNNILSPAHGAPLATPTQDMVLGAYYLTYGPEATELGEAQDRCDAAGRDRRPHVFRTAQEAELSYELGGVKLHDLAEFRPLGPRGRPRPHDGRPDHLQRPHRAGAARGAGRRVRPATYEFVNQSMRKRDTTRLDRRARAGLRRRRRSRRCSTRSRTSASSYATQAGITISKNDVVIPPSKGEILASYEAQVAEIQDQYDMGLITQEERHEAVVEQVERRRPTRSPRRWSTTSTS